MTDPAEEKTKAEAAIPEAERRKYALEAIAEAQKMLELAVRILSFQADDDE